jgi:octaprenyl-diphosphate synthase
MPLETIRSLVQSDLDATDRFICTELKSDIPFINQLMEYILTCGGKRIRPLLVLLTARAFQHQKQQHIDLAAAIELIHTATLLHDDVVDNASLRRGHETTNTIWGNEASVLVGDFLYSRAFQLIVKLENIPILHIFAHATNLIAEGEVLQLIHCHDCHTTEQSYFEVIERKTAKLFEVAAQIGAALSTDSSHYLKVMQQYGFHLGIAYQLIDDALDYRDCPEQTGKNMGNDLIEGKPTLPLIYALRQGNKSEAALLRKAIETGNTENLSNIIEIIESTGAIEYTANTAKHHAHKAIHILNEIPDSPYRDALQTLSLFVVERNY